MIDENNLKEEEKKLRENAGATNKEHPTAQPLEKDQRSDEEESDLEQQRKEAMTERD